MRIVNIIHSDTTKIVPEVMWCSRGEWRRTHGMSYTRTYKTWIGMLQRCNNPKSPVYKYYGGRNIKVCQRWYKLENFLADMGERPKGLTLERVNNNLGYIKSNCKWATQVEQARNRRLYNTNKTGINGVYWNKYLNKYVVQIMADNQNYYIGSFLTLEDAKIARLDAEQMYWGKKMEVV